MTVNNIQLSAIETAIAKLEALKAKTSPQTAYAGPRAQAADFEAAKIVAEEGALIADMFKVDMVFGAVNCLALSMADGAEDALLNTEALEDAFYEAEKLADEYSEGVAA